MPITETVNFRVGCQSGPNGTQDISLDVEMDVKVWTWLQAHCKNGWFMEYHARHVTRKFFDWWIGFYGDWPPRVDDLNGTEYFERMAYALYGWRAAKERETA